jgi:tRNA dimethylallyltransferase
MVAEQLNLLAIIGPTASGKTSLAIDIAKRFNGEIIAADSRTVYKDLDIGTAKPSLVERQGIVHWGFDLVGPGEKFTVADFQAYAKNKIDDIKKRGKLPILVGGSGLYIDAVLYNFSLAPQNADLRNKLQGLGVLELQSRICQQGLTMPENAQNKRYLVRTLERGTEPITKRQLPIGAYIIGLNPEKETLKQRITVRATHMLEAGVMDEVAWALNTYGAESEALTGGIYRIFRDVVWGKLTKDQATDLFVFSDVHLAKRQLAWFKRNDDIIWFKSAGMAEEWFMNSFGGTLR